ncbi:MAG: hypothetical protein KDA30_05450 [Phycisphaerales bacterium]|nr:hypothetical protein [Phycisphaerales bacterium]
MGKGNRGIGPGSNAGGGSGVGGDGVSHSERDELLTSDGAKPRARRRKRFKWLKRSAAALLLLVLLVAAGGYFFGPALLSKYAPGIIASQSRKQIFGAVEVDRVSFSWNNSQDFNSIRLLDPDGNVVADLNASLDRGLFALARNQSNLGTINIDGEINIVRVPISDEESTTNLAKAIEPRKKPSSSGAPSPGQQQAAKATARTVADTIASANLTGVKVTYKESAAAEPFIATIDGVASLDRGSVKVDLTGVTNLPDTKPVKLTVTGKDIFDALGNLQLAKANVDAALDVAVGDDGLIDLLRKLQPGQDWAAAIAGAPQPAASAEDAKGLRADLRFVVKGGTISVNPATPAFIRGRLTPAIIRAYLAENSSIAIDNAVTGTIAITQLDIPLPDFANGKSLMPDMRSASIKGYIETTPAVGTMTLAGQTDALRINPIKSTFGTEDFTKGLGLLLSTSWDRNGEPAGTLSADVRAIGVLDKEGGWKLGVTQPNGKKGEADDIRAEIIANALPTAIVQSFISDARIALTDLVGPKADIQVVYALEPNASASSDKGRGALITAVAAGDNAKLEANALVQSDRIASRAGGIRAQLNKVAPTAQQFLEGNATVTGAGMLLLDIPTFELPLKGGSKSQIDWSLASINADLHLGDMSLTMPDQASPIEVSDLHTKITMQRNAAARIDLDHQLRYNSQDFGPKGAITVNNLFAQNPAARTIDIENATFSGQIAAESTPTSLLAMFMDDDTAQIAREALGDNASLTIRASGASPSTKGELATVELAGVSGSTLNTKLTAGDQRLTVGPTTGKVVVTPNLFDRAEQQFNITQLVYDALGRTEAPAQRLRLGSVFAADLSAQPISILTDDNYKPVYKTDAQGKSQLQFLGTQQAMITAANAITLSGIPNPVPDAAGNPGAPMSLQLRDLRAAMSQHANAPADNEKSLHASIYEPSNTARPIATIDAVIRANELPLEARITDADAPAIDRLINRPGFIDGAAGSPVTASINIERPRERSGEYYLASVTAPRLKMDQIRLGRTADKAVTTLLAPLNLIWSPTRAWLDRYALGEGDPDARVRVDGDVSLTAQVNRLIIGAPDKPLDPAVFDVSAVAEIPMLTLVTREGQRETVNNVKLGVTKGESPGALNIKLTADDARSVQAVYADLNIRDLLSPEGKVDRERARVTGVVKGEVPTLLVDTVMGQKGLLVDTLGPDSNAELALTNVSMRADTGSVSANMTSNFAGLVLAGDIRDGVLYATGSPNARMSQISDAASRRLFSSLFPFLNQFEKTAQDKPAVLTATGLQLPLDGDMRKLNGTLNIDLGTIKFQTAPALAPFLKAIKAREAGEIGKKVPPFTATITNGVVRYEEVALPVGDVSMRTYGKVNLVKRKIEVIIMVPFASVSDDLAATVGRLPFVSDIAVVPLKVVGDLDSPRVEFDPELLVKNAIEKNPISSILDQLGGANDDKKDDKKKNNKPNN